MPSDLVKVIFPSNGAAWHHVAEEKMWASPLSEKVYELENSPFYVNGISYKDKITVKSSGCGDLYFDDIFWRGGHSTYRILLTSGSNETDFLNMWSSLEKLGCTYEGNTEGDVFAVDVPPSADIFLVYEYLESGASAGVWDFEEGHCGHAID